MSYLMIVIGLIVCVVLIAPEAGWRAAVKGVAFAVFIGLTYQVTKELCGDSVAVAVTLPVLLLSWLVIKKVRRAGSKDKQDSRRSKRNGG